MFRVYDYSNWPYERQLLKEDESILHQLKNVKLFCSNFKIICAFLPSKVITIFAITEPSQLQSHNLNFLKQFDIVISPYKIEHLTNCQIWRPLLPWFVGMYFNPKLKQWQPGSNYTTERLKLPIQKERLDKVCILSSNKQISTFHKERINFIKELVKLDPSLFDLYGVGFEPFGDKFDILSEYKYTLVIENSTSDNYWTEKLIDAIITETQVFYIGCPNLDDYFEVKSIIELNNKSPEECLAIIKETIFNSTFEKNIHNIRKIKMSIIKEFNIFKEVAKIVESIKPNYDKNIRIIWNERWYHLLHFLKL